MKGTIGSFLDPVNDKIAFVLKIDGRDAEKSSAVHAFNFLPNLMYLAWILLHQCEEKGLLSRLVARDRSLLLEFSHVKVPSEGGTASRTMTNRDNIEAK